MRELAVDVREVELEVQTLEGLSWMGRLFLHEHGHRGQETLLERFNDASLFLPLRSGEDVVLLRKEAVAFLRCMDIPTDVSEYLAVNVQREKVVLQLRAGLKLEGEVFLMLPGIRHRALDLFNSHGAFFFLSSPDGIRLINKSAIEMVLPAKDEP